RERVIAGAVRQVPEGVERVGRLPGVRLLARQSQAFGEQVRGAVELAAGPGEIGQTGQTACLAWCVIKRAKERKALQKHWFRLVQPIASNREQSIAQSPKRVSDSALILDLAPQSEAFLNASSLQLYARATEVGEVRGSQDRG